MKRRHQAVYMVSALAMGILILDSRTAFRGAEQGINLCLRTVIPALFPFLYLSSILTGWQGSFLLALPARLMGIPENASSVLIPAFLGGYPVGAQYVHQLYQNGSLPRRTAERMLAYCSNAGPSFLFGILTLKFTGLKSIFAIWMIQILSAWTVSVVFRPDIPSDIGAEPKAQQKTPMEAAISALSKICGWVILFRILIFFLERWFLWILPVAVRVFLMGVMELSNGCCMLDLIADASLRFVIANAILAFGGICVIMQTASVCSSLQMRCYLWGKLTQAAAAAILALLLVYKQWFLFPVWVVFFVLVSGWREKKSSFLKTAVV